MNTIKKIVVFSLAFSLSACGYIYGEKGLVKETKYDYLKSKQTKDLQIPSDLTHLNNVDFLPVPTIGQKAQNAPTGKDLRIDAPVQILAVLDEVRADRVSDNPAVYIQDSLENVWQSLTSFLVKNEIEPMILDKNNYFINTGWIAVDERGVWLGIENREEIDEFKAQFTFKITPAQNRGEVYLEVERVDAKKENDDTEQWENVPNYWVDSAEMLNYVLLEYESQLAKREVSRRAIAMAGFDSELGRDSDGQPAIVTSSELDLVWEKIPQVINKLKFKLSDRDRTTRTYYFEVEEKEEGFFASLFGSDVPSIQLADGDYQFIVSEANGQTVISLRDASGESVSIEILNKVFPNLKKLFSEGN